MKENHRLFGFILVLSLILPGGGCKKSVSDYHCFDDTFFDMGSQSDNPLGGNYDRNSSADEKPIRTVSLSSFCIKKMEVNVAEFRRCVDSGHCRTEDFTTHLSNSICNYGRTGFDAHPMNCVSWNGANSYCRWVSGRLPTEAEWEFTARGKRSSTYPWGDLLPTCTRVVYRDGCLKDRTWVVGSLMEGRTPELLWDLAGNVSEWVLDCKHTYSSSTEHNPRYDSPDGGVDCSLRGHRGGSWKTAEAVDLRSARRAFLAQDAKSEAVGFRCIIQGAGMVEDGGITDGGVSSDGGLESDGGSATDGGPTDGGTNDGGTTSDGGANDGGP